MAKKTHKAPLPESILLEELSGQRHLVAASWGARCRPWKFRHTDGRYFEAIGQEGRTWIYRTLEAPAYVPTTTVVLTAGEACCEIGRLTIPTAELGDTITKAGIDYTLHGRHADGFLHYHADA